MKVLERERMFRRNSILSFTLVLSAQSAFAGKIDFTVIKQPVRGGIKLTITNWNGTVQKRMK
jgi:hypothetical protein